MKTAISISAGLVLSALLTVSSQAQEPVRLGFLSSLSGTFGVLGAEQKRGLDLALEHLGNKLGGRPVTLIEVDDKSSPVELRLSKIICGSSLTRSNVTSTTISFPMPA